EGREGAVGVHPPGQGEAEPGGRPGLAAAGPRPDRRRRPRRRHLGGPPPLRGQDPNPLPEAERGRKRGEEFCSVRRASVLACPGARGKRGRLPYDPSQPALLLPLSASGRGPGVSSSFDIHGTTSLRSVMNFRTTYILFGILGGLVVVF